MLTERKVFLGCMMAVGLWAETVGAKPVEVIRPEDEAILEGVFELDGASAQQKRPSPMADGNGVAMKGARDATRIKAVPLNVTFGENASSVVSATTSSKEDKKDTSVKTSVDNTQEMTVEVNGGADLKNTMKTVVEGDTQKTTAPVEKVEKKTVKTTVKTINAQKADETSESATENASEYRYQDEIGYTYPSKSERAQARQPLNEWYNPNLRAADTYKTETKSAPQDETFMQYRLAIADCLDTRQDDLEMDKAMLKQGNMYDAAAYLSQTLEAVNVCYENIGYDIIRDYYGDEPQVRARFAQKISDFYISGSDVNFNPKFCGDDCSVEAMVDAQLAKFAEFRTYLAQLLNERPTYAPADVEVSTAVVEEKPTKAEVEYDEDGVPFIDEYLEEDEQTRANSVQPEYETRPLPVRSQPNYNVRPVRQPVVNGQGNRYETPEIL